MTEDNEGKVDIEALIERLRNEHRELDAEIGALESIVPEDQIRTSRLKKRKLQLKDMISCLENGILPDIIA